MKRGGIRIGQGRKSTKELIEEGVRREGAEKEYDWIQQQAIKNASVSQKLLNRIRKRAEFALRAEEALRNQLERAPKEARDYKAIASLMKANAEAIEAGKDAAKFCISRVISEPVGKKKSNLKGVGTNELAGNLTIKILQLINKGDREPLKDITEARVAEVVDGVGGVGGEADKPKD